MCSFLSCIPEREVTAHVRALVVVCCLFFFILAFLCMVIVFVFSFLLKRTGTNGDVDLA